ncbi:MAG TPA: hypothetical protein VIK72_16445 [Clostridiaceae bacterium]
MNDRKKKQDDSINIITTKKNKQSAASKKDVDSVDLINENTSNAPIGSDGEDF